MKSLWPIRLSIFLQVAFVVLVVAAPSALAQTVTLTPASRAFGNVGVGSPSASKTFTLRNTSRSAVSVDISTDGDFSQTNTCGGSVPGRGNCVITVTFMPSATGARSGTLSVVDTAGTQTGSLQGTGIAPLTVTPASRAFGNTALGTTSATKPFTAKNKGTVPLALTITPSAGFVETDDCGGSVAGGASCTINAAYSPTTTVQEFGTISVSYGFGSPVSVSVQGTGITPVTVSPTALTYSTTLRVGTPSNTRTVNIRNRSNIATLTINSIVASPASYTQTNNCGTSLPPTGTCSVTVLFTPAVSGTIPGTLTITDSAVGSPQIVTMTGGGAINNLRSIAITPANSSIPKGAQMQFKAIGTYGNGDTGDVTAAAVWSSSSAAITVGANTGLATAVGAGSATISAAVSGTNTGGGTVSNSTLATVSAAVLSSIALSPTNASVAPGATQQYIATGTYTDSTTATVAPSTLVFGSDNIAIATIDATGMATGVNGGTANIRASSGSITSPPVPLLVTGPTLESITITPNNPSIQKGMTQQFTATGNDSDGTHPDLTTKVTWSAGPAANISISNTAGSQGLASALTVGPVTISASWGGATVQASVPATVTPPPLTAIAVNPGSINLGLGAEQQYQAIGTYADNTTADITNQVTWISGNTSLVSINAAGLATVLGTSSTAIPITASLDGITSNPPGFLSALASLPRVCPEATIDMKVLVVTNNAANYVDLPAIKQILDYIGTPYTVMDISAVSASALSDGACHGYYQGVIMAFANDIYSAANLYTTLNTYETTFKVRQVNWFFNPTPDYGFNYAASTVPSTTTYSANFTGDAATVFPNINTATPLSISGAFIYLSPLYTPTNGGTVTPLLTDAAGNVLSEIYAPGNGQEILSQTFDSNQYLTHDLVLAYGLVNWVTKGVFLGDYRVYAAAQVDDFFINDAEWKPGTPCTDPITHDRTASDASFLSNFRLTGDDMTQLLAWQNSLQSDPLLTGFKLTLAFNGVGTTGNTDWTGSATTGRDNDTLLTTLPNYEQYFHWISHTYDHPNTLNGLHKSDPGGDTDNPKVDSIDLEILTNMFVANGSGQNLDVDPSDTTPPAGVVPLNFTDFNPINLVSPGVTGLNDTLVPSYLYADGIRYVVSDTSVLNQPNNGPNPSPNVGIVNSYATGIYEVPRYPNDVYYNAANWADDQAEFHCIYGPVPGPAQPPYDTYNAAQILDFVSNSFVVNMLKGDMDPQMFHQPDLHFSDNAAALGLSGTHLSSLISDTYNQTFSKYEALYKLPVISLTLDQLGQAMQNRNEYNLSGVTASLTGVGGSSPSISITTPNGAAMVPVSGLNSNGAESYGGKFISHISMTAGQTVTLPLQ